MLIHTCLISLNLILHCMLSALSMQGFCLFPDFKKSQLSAGPFPAAPPSSGITSLLTLDNLTLKRSLHFLKLIDTP